MRFKRITMPREVRKILQQIGKEKKQMFCKGSKDTFFGFRPSEYREDAGVLGRIVVFHAKPRKFEKVIVNFTLGSDRFFAQAKFGADESRGLLKFEPVFYRLERREHLRIPLLPSVQKVCNIIGWGENTVFIPADILDLSVGGIQVGLSAEKYRPARQGTKIKVVLHVKTKWRIEIMADIRRIEIGNSEVLLGLRFKVDEARTRRQLQALSMELQREFIRKEDYVES